MILEEQSESEVGYLEKTLLPVQEGDVLELDEVWSFVGSKRQRVWIWLALCRRTRQIVAWWYGSRKAASCRQLWNKIPLSYRSCFCYSDLWEAYSQVLPPEQHAPSLKAEGQTNHIERFNLTMRQRVGRLVRKSLSFSKKLLPHIRAIRHFLISYNLKIARKHLNKNLLHITSI